MEQRRERHDLYLGGQVAQTANGFVDTVMAGAVLMLQLAVAGPEETAVVLMAPLALQLMLSLFGLVVPL